MTSRTLRAGLAAFWLAAAAFAAPASAHDVTDVAQVVGTGGISPGLSATACLPQRVTFSGTAVNVGDHAGVYSIAFSGGSSGCETVAVGNGTGTLSGGVSGTVNYSRVGNIVTLTGSGAVNGAAHHITSAVCEFVPTSANPTTSYALHCTVTLGAGA